MYTKIHSSKFCLILDQHGHNLMKFHMLLYWLFISLIVTSHFIVQAISSYKVIISLYMFLGKICQPRTVELRGESVTDSVFGNNSWRSPFLGFTLRNRGSRSLSRYLRHFGSGKTLPTAVESS